MIVLGLLLLVSSCVSLEPAQSNARASEERPRLVVMVAVDQMVPEQLDRLEPILSGGLGRFVREGRVFRECALEYGATETGPGHATYATGCQPRRHGIVGNSWVPQEESAEVYCVGDNEARMVTADGPRDSPAYLRQRTSPRNLRVPTFGEHVRAALPGARVASISSKDRAAIAMAGQRADLVLWWNRVEGGFATSTHYADALPQWVSAWNAGWIERLRSGPFARGWEPLPLDEQTAARTGTAPDERPGESGSRGRTTLPYPPIEIPADPAVADLTRAAAAVYGSPLGDAFVLELAERAVVELELGADAVTDVLMVSLSSCDTVGHSFGPTSRETTDVLLRADRGLERLFALLDERVGRGRWIASLSADHGVLDLPEALVARGVGAVRVPLAEVNEDLARARAALAEEYGVDFVLGTDGAGLRLSAAAMVAAGVDPAAVRGRAAELLAREGADWVEAVFTADELGAAEPPAGAWARLWWNGFDPERSPDVLAQLRPWHLISYGLGTSHGSPYGYDRRVPLVFLGPGFPAGASFAPAAPEDAVPTLLQRLGLPPAGPLDGRVLR